MALLYQLTDQHHRITQLIGILGAVLATAALISGFTQDGVFNFSSKWRFVGLGWFLLSLTCWAMLLLMSTRHWKKIQDVIRQLIRLFHKLTWINLIFVLALVIIYPWLTFGPLNKHFEDFFFRAAVLWIFSIIGAFALKSFQPSRTWVEWFFFSLVIITAVFQGISYFRGISTYPLSLTWSEGSRFYYASLPFSQSLYGIQLPLSFMHPSRYLLMTLPFLIRGLPLWVHRAWQVALWLFLTGLGSLGLAKRLHLQDRWRTCLLTSWIFVFLFQGPVYYHLMICVILVVWGYQQGKFVRNLFFVVLASLWAGISRVNWFPLPGALAALIYLLEEKHHPAAGIWSYFKEPLSYGVVGMLVSLISQYLYIILSGNADARLFGTSFSSDLLWHRLLPNPTYPIGILTGILLLCAPLLWIISTQFILVKQELSDWRKLGISGILIVFLLGGLAVSVKIGGGSNLHNLDAFMVLLSCTGAYFLSKSHAIENGQVIRVASVHAGIIILLALIPLGWSLATWEPFGVFDRKLVNDELSRLNQTVQRVTESQQEVLFISERQLLTFGDLDEFPLVPDYELLTLMELSISNNAEYLTHFYEDLKNQRFGLIVANKQFVIYKDSSTEFPEENNAWVKHIVILLMKYYMPITWLREGGIEVFARRDLTTIQ
jgi:hypothetical protein